MARRHPRARRRGRRHETASGGRSAPSSPSSPSPPSSVAHERAQGTPTLPLRAQKLLPIQALARSNPPQALLLAEIPRAMVACWLPEEFAALTDEWSAEEITAAARAQANWLETLRRQDPRIVEQSEPISPEDLRSALRVMRSLFDWNTNPDLTLAGAMFWAGLLLDLNAAAEVRGETSPLPLPPLWLSRGELDMIERWDEVGKAECESGDEEGTGDDAEWPARHAQKPLRACAFPARRPRTLAAMPQPAAHSPSKVDESDGTSA